MCSTKRFAITNNGNKTIPFLRNGNNQCTFLVNNEKMKKSQKKKKM